jgi:hypothetical protein
LFSGEIPPSPALPPLIAATGGTRIIFWEMGEISIFIFGGARAKTKYKSSD